ncbi:MAG TPA: hypothetical protein VH558_01925 [Pseudolabrys sp.]|jgi:hypothetical protein
MPIDLAAVDWPYVAVLAALVFVSALVGNLLAFRHRVKAIVTTLVFVGLFVFWAYYPHGLPLPTSLKAHKENTAAPASNVTAPANSTTQ